MDTRVILSANDSFYDIVKKLYDNNTEAAILFENNGVTRASGMIMALEHKENKWCLTLEGGLIIPLDALYAINGIFSSDYSEC